MRKVLVEALRPGQKVGRPVYNSNGQILLNSGIILTESYIRRLKKIGIPALYIDDGLLPDVEINDVISEQTRVKAVQQVRLLLAEQEEKKSRAGRTVLITEKLNATLNEIIDQLLGNDSLMVNLVDIRTIDDYTFAHSVNVCVLALITGISMKYKRAKLFHLGIGALVHDIGKTKIDKKILNKPSSLTSEEFEEIKKHPIYGYNILGDSFEVSKLSRLVAYQHHERFEGQGYPCGLQRDEIHEFSRIVGMVDMYDALTADRVYRKAYPPHEAYEMIAGSGDNLFDFQVVQPFLQNIAAYPTGTIVQLSSGDIGAVVETYKGYSLYPKVRILFNAEGNPLQSSSEVNLAECRDLVVVRVLSEIDLPAPIERSLSCN